VVTLGEIIRVRRVGMGLRAIATFDAETSGGVGNGLVSWYEAALAGP
jgi:hypothetical protein